jgi:hypothetical protein
MNQRDADFCFDTILSYPRVGGIDGGVSDRRVHRPHYKQPVNKRLERLWSVIAVGQTTHMVIFATPCWNRCCEDLHTSVYLSLWLFPSAF